MHADLDRSMSLVSAQDAMKMRKISVNANGGRGRVRALRMRGRLESRVGLRSEDEKLADEQIQLQRYGGTQHAANMYASQR